MQSNTKNAKDFEWNNTAYDKDWIASMSDDIYLFSIKINVTKDASDIGVGFVTNNHHQLQKTETDFEAEGSVWLRTDALMLRVDI